MEIDKRVSNTLDNMEPWEKLFFAVLLEAINEYAEREANDGTGLSGFDSWIRSRDGVIVMNIAGIEHDIRYAKIMRKFIEEKANRMINKRQQRRLMRKDK